MQLVPVSFNGTDINDGTNYKAWIERSSANIQPSANTSYVARAGAYPIYSGKDFQSATFTIKIEPLGAFLDAWETLNILFNAQDENLKQLIVKDIDDSDKQYYVYATPKQATAGNDGANYTVTLALDDPVWQSVTQNSQTFSTTSATDSTSVTAAGNADSYPIFEITPTSQPSSDYLYNVFLQVLPTSTDPWPGRFLDVVGTSDGTGLDTAALIAGGKMQADGDDLRLFRDGVEIDRQLTGINSTDTHIICVCDMLAARNMTLRYSISSTDTVTSIELNNTTANRAEITAMPNVGRLIIDSGLGTTDTEEFTYTAKTITATKLAFTINARAVRGTVAANHSANHNVRHLPYDFNILYGNPSADAPTIDDTRKPIQELTSRNNSLIYANFYDLAGLRAGIFKPFPSKYTEPNLTNSRLFTSTDDIEDVDPAVAMGMSASPYLKLGVSKADNVTHGWQGYFPDGIASVAASGEQSQTSSVRPTVSLLSAATPTSFAALWTVAAQSTTDYSTWTTWSKSSSDATVGAGKKYLRWQQLGTISGAITTYAKIDITSLTIGITNPPHCMIRTEKNNYQLNAIIYNETTGENFRINLPMELGETVYIDTDPDFPNAKYKGQIVNGAIQLSSIRSAWLKLQNGANTIGYESYPSDAFDISIVIKWRDRMRWL
jgi:hypothetical protein